MQRKPPLIWLNITLFTLTFAIALLWVPWHGYHHGFDKVEWLSFILLALFSGLSITAGYHRLWSHKSYKASRGVKIIYALGGALALQNSALHWCSDHRVHHKHVDDNDKDPYSAKRGFWYSHIGWMLREYQVTKPEYLNARDLQNDPIVMWQHRHYLALVVVMNILLPLTLGWLNGDILSMLLLAGVMRLVLVHHCTFFINSLAHIWGKQPYTDKNTARDNGLLALLTYGEGYHNFHHIFEHDYRNGIHWWQYDPTKWLIQLLSWCRLTWDLRQVPQERIETARLNMQLKQVSHRLTRFPNCEELQQHLQLEYEQLKTAITAYYQAQKKLLEAKHKHLCDQQLISQVALLKRQLSNRIKHWQQFTARYS